MANSGTQLSMWTTRTGNDGESSFPSERCGKRRYWIVRNGLLHSIGRQERRGNEVSRVWLDWSGASGALDRT